MKCEPASDSTVGWLTVARTLARQVTKDTLIKCSRALPLASAPTANSADNNSRTPASV